MSIDPSTELPIEMEALGAIGLIRNFANDGEPGYVAAVTEASLENVLALGPIVRHVAGRLRELDPSCWTLDTLSSETPDGTFSGTLRVGLTDSADVLVMKLKFVPTEFHTAHTPRER